MTPSAWNFLLRATGSYPQALGSFTLRPSLMASVDRETLLARFHAQEAGGAIVSGAAAFAAMWRAIPLLWPLGQLARLPLAGRLLEWAYARFLTVRPALQARLR